MEICRVIRHRVLYCGPPFLATNAWSSVVVDFCFIGFARDTNHSRHSTCLMQAVLGLNCPEIHVCGGMEGAVLVEALAKEVRQSTDQ